MVNTTSVQRETRSIPQRRAQFFGRMMRCDLRVNEYKNCRAEIAHTFVTRAMRLPCRFSAVQSTCLPSVTSLRIHDFLDNKPGLYRRTRERLRKRLTEELMRAQGSLGTRARSLWQ